MMPSLLLLTSPLKKLSLFLQTPLSHRKASPNSLYIIGSNISVFHKLSPVIEDHSLLLNSHKPFMTPVALKEPPRQLFTHKPTDKQNASTKNLRSIYISSSIPYRT